MTGVRFGRYGETAMWIIVALRNGPRPVVDLLDDVRALDGEVGAATLFGAIARLERLDLVQPTRHGDDRPAYRLTSEPGARGSIARGVAT